MAFSRWWLVLIPACAADPSGQTRGPAGNNANGDTDVAATDLADTRDIEMGDTASLDPGVPCPAEMALVEGFCIDRWEAFLDGHSPFEVPTSGTAAAESGAVPQGYISGAVASAACETADKRLCTLSEWMRACQGPDGNVYPYGDTHDPEACNTSRATHPIVEYWGSDPDAWDAAHMNDPGLNQLPDTVDPAGQNAGCVSAEGVFDLHGNLHEWISDPNGMFKGGFFVDAVINGTGCNYATTAHAFEYHDYSTGFRCCREPSE